MNNNNNRNIVSTQECILREIRDARACITDKILMIAIRIPAMTATATTMSISFKFSNTTMIDTVVQNVVSANLIDSELKLVPRPALILVDCMCMVVIDAQYVVHVYTVLTIHIYDL